MRSIYAIFLFFIVFWSEASTSSLLHSETRLKRGVYAARSSGWSYHGDDGPETWCANYPACCGTSQSPLNLISDHSTYVHIAPISLTDYDIPRQVILTNTGHSVSLTLENNSAKPKISGGDLRGTYQLENIHFHWGLESSEGSEHEINGHAYPLESHFVHYNTKYANITVAASFTDGLAVLGVLHTIECDDTNYYDPIINALPNVAYYQESFKLPELLVLGDFLPRNLDLFYRYNGSLTTPPCSEVVTWTVFDNTIGISEKQMVEFRGDLHEGVAVEDGSTTVADDILHDNHRSPQDDNGRLVLHNVPNKREFRSRSRAQKHN